MAKLYLYYTVYISCADQTYTFELVHDATDMIPPEGLSEQSIAYCTYCGMGEEDQVVFRKTHGVPEITDELQKIWRARRKTVIDGITEEFEGFHNASFLDTASLEILTESGVYDSNEPDKLGIDPTYNYDLGNEVIRRDCVTAFRFSQNYAIYRE